MEIAKSGRRYRKIAEGYDVEEWDKMTPYQRLEAFGLIESSLSPWDKLTTKMAIQNLVRKIKDMLKH
jgi:hypothetical protein